MVALEVVLVVVVVVRYLVVVGIVGGIVGRVRAQHHFTEDGIELITSLEYAENEIGFT